MKELSPYELFKKVQTIPGARGHFILARIQLKTGIDFRSLSPADLDTAKQKKLLEAIREYCPEALT